MPERPTTSRAAGTAGAAGSTASTGSSTGTTGGHAAAVADVSGVSGVLGSDDPPLSMSKPPGKLGATKSTMPDPLIGRTINNRFTITGLIARGGMGKVYRAEQSPLNRICALKVLNPSYAGDVDPEFHKRFFLEASIASKLTHPNTVTIFDYGRTDDDIYYMAMEYLEGVTLHRAIRASSFLPEERTAHVVMQICRALREAHMLGVIHRDLKPANIFLVEHGDEHDFVKVLDFGLVKDVTDPKPGDDQLTQTGLFMGSPKYMAPEQIRGEKVDARTDIYSLGVMMYEMLSGKVPFERASSVHTLMAHVNDPPPPLRTMKPDIVLSTAMEEVVMKCIAKAPDLRFDSMDDVLAALKQVLGFGPSVYPPGVTGNFHALAAIGSGSYPGHASNAGTSTQIRSEPPLSLVSATPPPHGAEVGAPPPPNRRSRAAIALFLTGFALAVGVSVLAVGPRLLLGGNAARGSGASSMTEATGASPPPAPAPHPAASAAPLATSASTAAAPTTGVAAPNKPATAPVVHVTSEPAGALVREDGREVCAATPCDLGYDAAASDLHHLVVSKAGFRNELRDAKVGDLVSVRLVRATPAWVAPRPQDSSTPQGFKEIPY